MEITQKKISNSEIELTINLGPQDINQFIDKAVEETGKDLEVPGFRKGKAPKDVIEQKFGKEYLYEEASKMALQDKYADYILENKIDVIDKPEVGFSKFVLDGEVEFTAKVQTLPELDLPDYKKLGKEVAKEKKTIEVTDKDLEDTIKYIIDSRAKFETFTEGAKEGQIADISFEILKDNTPVEGEKQEKYRFVIGKEPIFQELNTELLQAKKDDEKEITITFPNDYHNEPLRGQRAIMKLKVNDILEKKLPELNDEFAKTLGEFKDVEALKANVKEGIAKEKQMHEDERIKLLLLEKIREKIKEDPPEVLTERELNYMLEDIKHKISHLGMEFETYLTQIKKTEDEMKEELKPEAKKKVLDALIIREIIKKEKITAEEKDINNKVNELVVSLSYQVPDPTKIDKEGLKGYATEICENEKMFDILLG